MNKVTKEWLNSLEFKEAREERRKIEAGPTPGTCSQCGGKSQRVAKFDTFGCPSCLVWTEERHTPDNCPDCPFEYPPERPAAEMFGGREK